MWMLLLLIQPGCSRGVTLSISARHTQHERWGPLEILIKSGTGSSTPTQASCWQFTLRVEEARVQATCYPAHSVAATANLQYMLYTVLSLSSTWFLFFDTPYLTHHHIYLLILCQCILTTEPHKLCSLHLITKLLFEKRMVMAWCMPHCLYLPVSL